MYQFELFRILICLIHVVINIMITCLHDIRKLRIRPFIEVDLGAENHVGEKLVHRGHFFITQIIRPDVQDKRNGKKSREHTEHDPREQFVGMLVRLFLLFRRFLDPLWRSDAYNDSKKRVHAPLKNDHGH